MGGWVDGLIMISQLLVQLQCVVVVFEQGGGRGKLMYLQVKFFYVCVEQVVLEGVMEQWSVNVLLLELVEGLDQFEQFEVQVWLVSVEELCQYVYVLVDFGQYWVWLQELQLLGFDCIYLYNVNCEQDCFIDDFVEYVLFVLCIQVFLVVSYVQLWFCR